MRTTDKKNKSLAKSYYTEVKGGLGRDITQNDIVVELPELQKNHKTTVHYNGVLNSNGAEQVYIHYGFDGWHNANTIAMQKTHDGCYAMEIDVKGEEEVNFCFKDNADNWDNNSGNDWSVGIINE